MKYAVVDISLDHRVDDEWIMFESDNLEEAKASARDFDYINKRDNNKSETMLVVKSEWEEGNYTPIDFK